jgi:hypothetical protein
MWKRKCRHAVWIILGLALALTPAAAFGQIAAGSGNQPASPAKRAGSSKVKTPSKSHKSKAPSKRSKKHSKKKNKKSSQVSKTSRGTTTLPYNVVVPKLTGTAMAGDTLTSTVGIWVTYLRTTYSVAWVDCNTLGQSCTSITGATGRNYTLRSTDVGKTVESVVTATGAPGNAPNRPTLATADSAPTAQVVAAIPANLNPPTVTGTARQGNTLTANPGQWANSPTSFSYTWEDCVGGSCTPIAGASTTSYVTGAGDVGAAIEVVVTASNATGSSPAVSSSATSAVLPAVPSPTSAPSISGTAQQGDTLTAATGSWTNQPTSYSYTWEDCIAGTCTPIPGATSVTYTLQPSDVGATIEVLVDASNAGGSGTGLTSAATNAVLPAVPANTSVPVISGAAAQGQVLTAGPGTWTNSPTSYSYAWQDCTVLGVCSSITGATSASYTLTPNDVGDTVEVLVTATNAGGSSLAADRDRRDVDQQPDELRLRLGGLHELEQLLGDLGRDLQLLRAAGERRWRHDRGRGHGQERGRIERSRHLGGDRDGYRVERVPGADQHHGAIDQRHAAAGCDPDGDQRDVDQ